MGNGHVISEPRRRHGLAVDDRTAGARDQIPELRSERRRQLFDGRSRGRRAEARQPRAPPEQLRQELLVHTAKHQLHPGAADEGRRQGHEGST